MIHCTTDPIIRAGKGHPAIHFSFGVVLAVRQHGVYSKTLHERVWAKCAYMISPYIMCAYY